MGLALKNDQNLAERTAAKEEKPMIILPSRFTLRRLEQIQATTDRLNAITEEIAVTKAKRACLENILPKLCHTWTSTYTQIEALWLEQLRLESEHRRIWTEVSACLGELVPVTTKWRVDAQD